ncbi:hypothetical protein [Oribacterium sinus]|uniref:Uncharacterized protein n=1 Tax=Oribacterium sinus F0268 TaxID=585501 RepID=C2KY68_9FIRM|nr:hypothetical protein [Oribacterium sinus]EEJ51291.1 hypothetical protein HMPREF6123_1437 [Oribacterium sinus F0268]
MNTQAGCEQDNGLTLLKTVRKDEECLIYKYIFKRKEGKIWKIKISILCKLNGRKSRS